MSASRSMGMASRVTTRRGVLLALATLPLALSCKKGEARCKHCGMKIDPASPWRAELVNTAGVTSFDTPRCALTSWRTGASAASSIRVQEYYERRWRSGEEIAFILGGDVVGPMGPDLVPVDPARATKFIQDHGADRSLRLPEITADFLKSMK